VTNDIAAKEELKEMKEANEKKRDKQQMLKELNERKRT